MGLVGRSRHRHPVYSRGYGWPGEHLRPGSVEFSGFIMGRAVRKPGSRPGYSDCRSSHWSPGRSFRSDRRRGTDAHLAGNGLLRPRPLPSCRCSASREGCARRDGGATDGRGSGRLRRQRLAGVGSSRRRGLGVWVNRTSVRTVQLRDVLTGGGLPLVSCVNRYKDRLRVSQPSRARHIHLTVPIQTRHVACM